MRDTDKRFLKWAIHKIVTWRNEYKHANLLHLHGTADRILPYQYIKNAVPVKDGGHLMIADKAALLTNMLRNILSSPNIPS